MNFSLGLIQFNFLLFFSFFFYFQALPLLNLNRLPFSQHRIIKTQQETRSIKSKTIERLKHMNTALPHNNNHPKCRQNIVIIWNGLYSVVFLTNKKKHPFQNSWLYSNYRQNLVIICNGLYSEVFLANKKVSVSELLVVNRKFVAIWRAVIGR